MGQNFQFQIEPFEFDYEMEEEGETDSPNRSSRAFVKWVQESLNQILGLKSAPMASWAHKRAVPFAAFSRKEA